VLYNTSDSGFKEWNPLKYSEYPRISAEWILDIYSKQNVCLTRLEIPCGTIIHYLEKVGDSEEFEENTQVVHATIPQAAFLRNSICRVAFNDPSRVRITHFKLPEQDPYLVRKQDLSVRFDCTPDTVYHGLDYQMKLLYTNQAPFVKK
jgi:hypothetical protein